MQAVVTAFPMVPDKEHAGKIAMDQAIAVAGISLGLYPQLLLAGFCGAMWSLSIRAPLPATRRILIALVSTFVAGYGTPAIVTVARSRAWWPPDVTFDMAQYPCAMLIGFLAHQVIGPWLLKIAARQAEGTQ